MKVLIKHTIDLNPSWLDKLISDIIMANKTIYSSDAEEMISVKDMLEPEIKMATKEAFNAGMNISSMGGDMMDTTKYTSDYPTM